MSKEIHYLKKELDQRLKADSTLFDWIEGGSLDGIWYWDLENQEHEWLSPSFKALFGYQEDEIPHTPEWWQKNIFPEDLPGVLENFEKHCEDPSHPYDQIVRYRHKDGSTVWVRCRGKVMFDSQGKPVRMIGAHTDLTPLISAKEELSQLAADLADSIAGQQAVFEAILDSIVVINQNGIILDVNAATKSLFGYTKDELVGQNVSILMDSDEARHHDRYLTNYLATGRAKIIGKGREIYARKKSGELFHAHLSIAKYRDSGGTKFVGTLRDISDQVKARLNLEFHALHDPLTELATRRLLEQKIENAISESIRDDKQFCILFIDLDKFKPVNDELGHDVGDEVLKIVAKRLVHSLRGGDLCSRLGGDEFVVLCEPSETKLDTNTLTSKLKNHINKPMHINGHRLTLDVSIGIACYPSDGKTKNELLRHADARMYDEKRGNRHG